MLLLLATLVCTDCHRDVAARYSRTPMARSSGAVVASTEQSGKVGRRYRITDAMKLEWVGGAVDLTFYIGSRRMGRSFAYARDGYLYQAPVGYYANRQTWDMAPGYEHDAKPDLNRPITGECLFCHATGAVAASGSVNRYEQIGHGIQCARCHGTPGSHEGLVNPRKLNARARDSVCDQCHLAGTVRLTQAGKRLTDFRPGEDLSNYIEVFVGGASQENANNGARPRLDSRGVPSQSGGAERALFASKGMKVNSHSDALAGSRCKQESTGKLWCGTCHNPHQSTVSFNAVCQNCHEKPHRTGDCVGCHMPKGKAYDGGHTVFTDHSLSPRPRPRELASYFGREPSPRNLGLAYVQLGRDRHDTSYFEKAWPLLRDAASSQSKDPQLYATIGGLLAADGRTAQAQAYYRLSLEQDPLQPDVLNKLAALLGNSTEGKALRERSAKLLPQPF